MMKDKNPEELGGFDAFTPPKFDSLYDYPEKFADLARATNEMAMASAKYQFLNLSQFWSAWMDHGKDHAAEAYQDPFSFIDAGFNHANEEMLKLHNSEDFMKAQKELVTSLARLRTSQREVAEIFQTWTYTPTQTDVDELTETVYSLRREIRRLKNQQGSKPGESS